MSKTDSIRVKIAVDSKTRKVFVPVDEAVERALPKGKRPSKRAIRVANALMLENMLMRGVFPSVEAAMAALGITRFMRTHYFRVLQMPPDEMARVLAETY